MLSLPLQHSIPPDISVSNDTAKPNTRKYWRNEKSTTQKSATTGSKHRVPDNNINSIMLFRTTATHTPCM
jgi:hypothetical protein